MLTYPTRVNFLPTQVSSKIGPWQRVAEGGPRVPCKLVQIIMRKKTMWRKMCHTAGKKCKKTVALKHSSGQFLPMFSQKSLQQRRLFYTRWF